MLGRLTTFVGGVLLVLGAVTVLIAEPANGPTLPTATASPIVAILTPQASTNAPLRRAIPEGYRVQVPRLGIDLPIFEGDLVRDSVLGQTPENAAFHYPGSAIPGDGSNTYLYAHARIGMFLSLWSARQGDEVIILTPDGRSLLFVVGELKRVDPKDTTVVQPTTREQLTLQTSTGPREEDPRFVVVAFPK